MTREEAIKWVDDRMCWGRGKFTENHPSNIDECWEAGCMAIEALSAERTGKWIKKSDGIIFKREWGICSECGDTLDFSRLNAGRGNANFCPKCGARMGE